MNKESNTLSFFFDHKERMDICMKKWLVTIEISFDHGKKLERVNVEAGNKKLAALRAMQELNREGYGDVYKTVKDIMEV